MLTVSETLNRAADLIEERDWVQGDGWVGATEGTRLCLEGGIMAASGFGYHDYSRFIKCPAYLAVGRYLEHETPYPFIWNDRENRTTSEVIEVLRACALIEAAKEQEAAWATYAELVPS